MKELFKPEEVNTMPYPDLRKYKDLFENIKTPVCGKLKPCEFYTIACRFYCIKAGAGGQV